MGGYRKDSEPGWLITARDKVLRLDDTLSKSMTPQELKGWRENDRRHFIDLGESKPGIHEWRVMKNKPKNGTKVIDGKFTDAFVTTFSDGAKLYVLIKKAGG